MVILEARVVDPTHLELREPIDIPSGSEVIVSVVEPDGASGEENDWREFSLAGLAAAYGEDEPEYTKEMIVEPNPEFEA